MVENNLKSLDRASLFRTVNEFDRRLRNLERLFNQPIDAARLTNINAVKLLIESDYLAGPGQNFTSTTFADVAGTTMNLDLAYDSEVLIIMNCDLDLTFSTDAAATVEVGISVDGETPQNTVVKRGEQKTAGGVPIANSAFPSTHSTLRVRNIAAGAHTIRLKGRIRDLIGSSQTGRLLNFGLTYVVLGTGT